MDMFKKPKFYLVPHIHNQNFNTKQVYDTFANAKQDGFSKLKSEKSSFIKLGFERAHVETMKVSLREFFTIGDAVSKFGGYYKSVSLPMSFLVSFISLALLKKYYSQLVVKSQP